MKLTKPQLRELKRLAEDAQHTFGPHRAKVQNNLVSGGFARFYETSYKTSSGSTTMCEITAAGRRALGAAK